MKSLYSGPVFDMAREQFHVIADHLGIPEDEREPRRTARLRRSGRSARSHPPSSSNPRFLVTSPDGDMH